MLRIFHFRDGRKYFSVVCWSLLPTSRSVTPGLKSTRVGKFTSWKLGECCKSGLFLSERAGCYVASIPFAMYIHWLSSSFGQGSSHGAWTSFFFWICRGLRRLRRVSAENSPMLRKISQPWQISQLSGYICSSDFNSKDWSKKASQGRVWGGGGEGGSIGSIWSKLC